MLEAVAVGLGGGVLGALMTGTVGHPLIGALPGGLNGMVSGALGIYAWRSASGRLAFVLDSTWGLVGTSLGLVIHLVNVAWPRVDYVEEISLRRNRHVYAGGLALRGGFALSMGNVISNGGGKVGLRGESDLVARRRRFVTAHEELHIWQNRLFGPFFHVLYGAWLVLGTCIGLVMWPVVRGGLLNAVETMAYYNNPFEFWAYRNDDYWPPRGSHPRLAVRSSQAPIE